MVKKAMVNKSTRTNKEDTQIAVMANDISYIKSAVKELTDKVDSKYVTKEEFSARLTPVRNIAYGIIGLLGLVIVGVIIALLSNSLGSGK